jgi:cyclohexyl-isocyanide hydratase
VRWLFHVRSVVLAEDAAPYAPESLAREGFIHASYRDKVMESARLYFPSDAQLEVLQLDPRRLDARVIVVATPRGPMPHIHGAIPRVAICATHPLAQFEAHAAGSVPDVVTGTRFAVVAFEGMTLLDLVGVYDPLSRIRSMGFDAASSCEIVGAHDGPIWAADGAELTARRIRPLLAEFDVLVVPGGPGTRALVHDESLVDWLRSFPDNRVVASVCTGALLLGAAGRLRGRRATTHASALEELAAYGATAVRERVVDEGQLVTAGGVTSGIDLGLHLVRRLEGDEAAEKIARQMETRA